MVILRKKSRRAYFRDFLENVFYVILNACSLIASIQLNHIALKRYSRPRIVRLTSLCYYRWRIFYYAKDGWQQADHYGTIGLLICTFMVGLILLLVPGKKTVLESASEEG